MSDLAIRSVLETVIQCYSLKNTSRAGWVKRGIRVDRNTLPPIGESVAEHVALMHTLTLFLAPLYNERAQREGAELLDIAKLQNMIAVHDLPESAPDVGDTASDGSEDKIEKARKERAAMVAIAEQSNNPSLLALWEEYGAKKTTEAQFAGDLDKIEMFVQAYLYRQQHPEHSKSLDEFFIRGVSQIKTSLGKDVLRELLQLYNGLANEAGTQPIAFTPNLSAGTFSR